MVIFNRYNPEKEIKKSRARGPVMEAWTKEDRLENQKELDKEKAYWAKKRKKALKKKK